MTTSRSTAEPAQITQIKDLQLKAGYDRGTVTRKYRRLGVADHWVGHDAQATGKVDGGDAAALHIAATRIGVEGGGGRCAACAACSCTHDAGLAQGRGHAAVGGGRCWGGGGAEQAAEHAGQVAG
jgi:hypothetical protein